LTISYSAYETPLIFDLGGAHVIRALQVWCAVVFITGSLALVSSAIATDLALVACAALGLGAVVLSARAQAASRRYDQIIVTARGDIGVVERAGAHGATKRRVGGGSVCAARLTGRNLCLPGLWLLEIESPRRQVVVLNLAGRSGWDRARLHQSLGSTRAG